MVQKFALCEPWKSFGQITDLNQGPLVQSIVSLTLLHSERPKLYAVLAFLSAVGLMKSLVEDLLKSYNTHKIKCSYIFAEKLKGTFAL